MTVSRETNNKEDLMQILLHNHGFLIYIFFLMSNILRNLIRRIKPSLKKKLSWKNLFNT